MARERGTSCRGNASNIGRPSNPRSPSPPSRATVRSTSSPASSACIQPASTAGRAAAWRGRNAHRLHQIRLASAVCRDPRGSPTIGSVAAGARNGGPCRCSCSAVAVALTATTSAGPKARGHLPSELSRPRWHAGRSGSSEGAVMASGSPHRFGGTGAALRSPRNLSRPGPMRRPQRDLLRSLRRRRERNSPT